MKQTALNKLLVEGIKKQAAYNGAKRELDEWDNKFRQHLKGFYQESQELVQSPKDEDNFYD